MTKQKILRFFYQSKDGFIWAITHYTLGFVIVLAITVISCTFSVVYLSSLERELTRTFEYEIKGQDYSQKAYALMISLENEVKDLAIFGDAAHRGQTRDRIGQDIGELRATMRAADSRFYTNAGRDILRQSLQSLNGFIGSVQALSQTLNERPLDDEGALEALQEKRSVLAADLQHLINNKTANSYGSYAGLIGQLRLSLVVTIAILLVTIAIRLAMYLSGRKQRLASQTAAPKP